MSILTSLGLTSGLKLCLDAGDASSITSAYPDKWLDLSGNGYDFFFGTGTGADVRDPSFHGDIGKLTPDEYVLTTTGGEATGALDRLTYDAANETWMENLHKDGARFTIAMWLWVPQRAGANTVVTGAQPLIGNQGAGTGISFQVVKSFNPVDSLDRPSLRFSIPSSVIALNGSVRLDLGAWNFIAVSLDEPVGAGGAILYANGKYSTHASTYTTPSAGASGATFSIGTDVVGVTPGMAPSRGGGESGWRFGAIMCWEGADPLTSSQLDSIMNADVQESQSVLEIF